MKTLKSFFLSVLALGLMFMVSCNSNEETQSATSVRQVINLVAVPGDEEVTLSWELPEGWEATDFIVYYNAGEVITFYTGGAMTYTVENLVNDTDYIFYVQAVYGTSISNPVSVSATPTTSRVPVKDLAAETGDQYVKLSWTKPSDTLQGYTLSYYNESDENNVTTETLDADAVSVTIDGLVNDLLYYFSLTVVYKQGDSEPVSIRIMPGTTIPYFLDREQAALNQPITFTFNTEDFPTATDVKWTFPGGDVLEGTVVKYGFKSTGTQTATLSANVNGVLRNWTAEVDIREYVIFSRDWVQKGTSYNGFKGSCPVFSPDGQTLYDITYHEATGLYAFDLLTGEEKWRFLPSSLTGSYNPFTVNPITGDIYFGTQTAGQFFAVSPDGEQLWQFSGARNMKSCAPAVNAAGTVVFLGDTSGSTFALDATTGSQIWTFTAGGLVAGLLVNGDELVVGSTNTVYFLNVNDGTLIDQINLPKTMVELTGFAVSNDKKTAYCSLRTAICSIDLESHQIVATLTVGSYDNYTIVVSPNGSLTFPTHTDNGFYNVRGDLSGVNWSFRFDSIQYAYGTNYGCACVDTENRIYFTAGDGMGTAATTYIFDESGNVVDMFQYDDATEPGMQYMGGNNYLDGVIYTAETGVNGLNGLLAGKYVGGERADTWSTHGGDICGSNCIK